jgi:hypothetical protein
MRHVLEAQLPTHEPKVDNQGVLGGPIALDNALIADTQRPRSPTFQVDQTAHTVASPVGPDSAANRTIIFLGPADLVELHLASHLAKVHHHIRICCPVAFNDTFVALVQRRTPMKDSLQAANALTHHVWTHLYSGSIRVFLWPAELKDMQLAAGVSKIDNDMRLCGSVTFHYALISPSQGMWSPS